MKQLLQFIQEKLVFNKHTKAKSDGYSFKEFDNELTINLHRLTLAEHETLIDQLRTIIKIQLKKTLTECNFFNLTENDTKYDYYKKWAEDLLSKNAINIINDKSSVKRFYAIPIIEVDCYVEYNDNNIILYFIDGMENKYYIYKII